MHDVEKRGGGGSHAISFLSGFNVSVVPRGVFGSLLHHGPSAFPSTVFPTPHHLTNWPAEEPPVLSVALLIFNPDLVTLQVLLPLPRVHRSPLLMIANRLSLTHDKFPAHSAGTRTDLHTDSRAPRQTAVGLVVTRRPDSPHLEVVVDIKTNVLLRRLEHEGDKRNEKALSYTDTRVHTGTYSYTRMYTCTYACRQIHVHIYVYTQLRIRTSDSVGITDSGKGKAGRFGAAPIEKKRVTQSYTALPNRDKLALPSLHGIFLCRHREDPSFPPRWYRPVTQEVRKARMSLSPASAISMSRQCMRTAHLFSLRTLERPRKN